MRVCAEAVRVETFCLVSLKRQTSKDSHILAYFKEITFLSYPFFFFRSAFAKSKIPLGMRVICNLKDTNSPTGNKKVIGGGALAKILGKLMKNQN